MKIETVSLTLQELIASGPDTASATNLKRASGYLPSIHGGEWYDGIESLDQAQDFVERGWSEGADKVSDLARQIANEIPAARTRRRVGQWADSGDHLDIDRALSGHWDGAWRTSKRQMTRGPSTVDLVIGWGGNCDRDREQLFWSGAAGLVVADVLEEAGYRVALRGDWLIYTDRARQADATRAVVSSTTLKHANEPLQIDALASVLCHAGVFRTLGFLASTRAETPVPENFGWSHPLGQNLEALRENAPDNWANVAIIDNIYNREGAIDQIRKVLAPFAD